MNASLLHLSLHSSHRLSMGEPSAPCTVQLGSPFADCSSRDRKGRAQMNTSLRSIVLVALMSVIGVRHVSGFAQADTPLKRRAAFVARGARLRRDGQRRASTRRRRAQSQRRLSIGHRRKMLARSPTFRRQCARLAAAAAHLSVSIRSRPSRQTRAGADRNPAGSPADGFKPSSYRSVGADGRAHRARNRTHHRAARWRRSAGQVATPRSGVRRVRDADAYETTRAIATGLRVARELNEQVPAM